MDYKSKYLKYKAKYESLKSQLIQNGGASVLDGLDLVSPADKNNDRSPVMNQNNIDNFRKQLSPKPLPTVSPQQVAAMRDFRKPVPQAPKPVPQAPKPVPQAQTQKTHNLYVLNSPVLGNTFYPGDRVMKVRYTSDALSGMLGDRGTVINMDSITGLVAVQFDRFMASRLVSYIHSSNLKRIYDSVPKLYRPRIYDDDYEDDEDDDLFTETRPKRKSSKKKRTTSKRKTSKKQRDKSSKKDKDDKKRKTSKRKTSKRKQKK